MNYINYLVTALLIISTVLLGLLIPGGPIEKRSFAHISPFILSAFNTFLTVLGFGSLMIAFFVYSGNGWVLLSASICGISYFLVYALDLGKLFPVSPDKMPRALIVIEVIGLLIAIPLTVLSLISAYMLENDTINLKVSSGFIAIMVLIVLLGVGIVIFATRSAMKK